jgi:L-rhamnose mutarotase
MEHVMFVQEVKAEKRDEYIGAHRDAWPDLLKAIKDSGIEREMIWMHGNNIYIYIMSENFDRAMAVLAEKQVFKDWIEKMEPLLAMMQDYSGEGNVIRLDKVFDLEKQLEEAKE